MLWFAILRSAVHAAVAGILLAMTTRLGGIGFTMSLCSDLAFGGGPVLALAKIGIPIASVVAGGAGYAIPRFASQTR